MKVIKPTVITDAMLISSTAAEPSGSDPAAWNAATAYALGDLAYRAATHRVYRRLVAGTTATAPENDLAGAAPNWADYGPTHRWAMFDSQVSTATSNATPLTVVLAPGYINALALLEIAGTAVSVTITDGPSGATVYSRSLTLDGTIISDWYQYVWEPFDALTQWVLTDIPPYAAARITVSVTGGTPSLGVLLVGTVYNLGETRMGARLSIVDYSRKETAADGTTTFVRRKYSRRMDANLILSNAQLDKVNRVLADLRATPCVWIGSDAAGYESLIVFGFYRDFSIAIDYPAYSLCPLQIEGLV